MLTSGFRVWRKSGMGSRNRSSVPPNEESHPGRDHTVIAESSAPRSQSQPFPTLSPPMAPEIAQAGEVIDIPPLEDTDDEDYLPTIQQLLDETRPGCSQRQSQGKRKQVEASVERVKEEDTGTEGEHLETEPGEEEPVTSGADQDVEGSTEERDEEEMQEPQDAGEADQLGDEIPKVEEEEPQAINLASAAPISTPISTSRPVKRNARPSAPITPRRHRPTLGSLAAPIEILASPSDSSPETIGPSRKRSHPSDGCRSTKRARKTSRTLMKHETHWYLDGNVIVKIKNTQFKLHRSRLVKISDWFRAKFEPGSMGHDAKGVSHVGNDVILEIDDVDVTAEDFETLLDAFDDAILYYHEDPPFEIVASILRALTFFRVSNFRNWAIRVLEDKWPSDLADIFPEPISYARESVILARKCRVPTILKRALYELVRHDDEDDDDYNASESRPRLSNEDTKALNRTLRLLIPKWLSVTSHSSPDFAHCPSQGEGCTTADPRATQEAHRNLVILSGIQGDYSGDPLCGLKAMMEAPWGAEGFCQQCVAMRKTAWRKTRERIWEDCDIWFGLHKS